MGSTVSRFKGRPSVRAVLLLSRRTKSSTPSSNSAELGFGWTSGPNSVGVRTALWSAVYPEKLIGGDIASKPTVPNSSSTEPPVCVEEGGEGIIVCLEDAEPTIRNDDWAEWMTSRS